MFGACKEARKRGEDAGNQGEWGTAHATRHHNGIMRQKTIAIAEQRLLFRATRRHSDTSVSWRVDARDRARALWNVVDELSESEPHPMRSFRLGCRTAFFRLSFLLLPCFFFSVGSAAPLDQCLLLCLLFSFFGPRLLPATDTPGRSELLYFVWECLDEKEIRSYASGRVSSRLVAARGKFKLGVKV